MTRSKGWVIASGTVWNLAGQLIPVLAAVLAIPVLVRQLGTDRFAILTLAWALVGYFSLFDLGLGRALTRVVAERQVTSSREEMASLIWTGLYLMTCLGVIGGVALALIDSTLVHTVLKVPVDLQGETETAFLVLACCIPIVVASSGARGVLEAQLRFDLTNAVRIPLGVATFVGPIAVLPLSHTAVAVVGVLALTRVVGAALHFWLCLRLVPAMRRHLRPNWTLVTPLLRFGSWMTVSNVISPLMVSVDRFVIGALVSLSAVAYYSTPFEVVTKLLLIPSALVTVLFPAFSATFAHDHERTALLFRRGTKAVLLLLFPFTLLAISFAHDLLAFWLGGEFAITSAPVLQVLAIGVFANGLAHVPFALVQGVGRPDLTAKVHLVELPIYLTAVWVFTVVWGITGAAVAWTLRAAIDAIFLFIIAARLRYGTNPSTRRIALITSGALLIIAFTTDGLALRMKVLVAFLSLTAFGAAGWSVLLRSEDRAVVTNGIRALKNVT